MTNKIIHQYSGASLIKLHKKYNDLFWSKKDPWWIKEAFAKESAPKGTYELTFDKNTVNKTYAEQTSDKGLEVPYVAIVVEAILEHFKKTGERICEDWYVRTSSVVSDGDRVHVGHFAGEGLLVNGCWDDDRHSVLGLASARNLKLEPGELDTLESLILRVKKLEDWRNDTFK